MAFHVLFRLDDICPQMNYGKFKRFQDIFDRYDIKPVIGVVPDNKDNNLNRCERIPDFWGMMRQLKKRGWTIAMHGHTHVYTTKEYGLFNRGGKSEFAGLPYEEQLAKIERGAAILKEQGLETDLFMAPSNTVDENTMKALRLSGFHYLTIGSADAPYEWHGLTIIPCRDAKPRRFQNWGLSTVCFHPNTAPDRIFLLTEQFLKQHREAVISFPEACQLPKISLVKAKCQEKIYQMLQDKIDRFIYPMYKKLRKND